ncbi:MAG TPA: carboxypeptidase-like regulatory domain-containing protein, partial [Bacteroidia bacterium]|nr:carboxypeptidase-like regulatory domain-containing protein [Bacteroidia bacterium]
MKKAPTSLLKCSFIFLSLICFSSAFSATIKGHISDIRSNEKLIGALVYLKENNQVNDAAGLDGSYTLKNLQPGTYTLTVEFLGYIKQEKSIVIADASDIVIQDISLAPDSLTLKQVEVTGTYGRESDNYARSLEKTNDYLLNVISAKTMLLLPDITVGDVLQRVSGVVTQKSVTGGGKYAVIRGMDKRYNYTTVNGVKLPSPDYENKYVPMDMFPSAMLERLEVIKTLRPDMEGDATGGVMNLVLKSPPDYLAINAEASTGYGQNLFSSNFNSVNASAINSKSPAQINGPNYFATPSDFPTGPFTYNSVKASPDASAGFTFGDRYLNNKLGLILSAIYQNDYHQTNSFFLTPSAQPTWGPNYNNPNIPVFDDIENRTYSIQETRYAAHLKLDYEINPKNKISFYTMYVGMNQFRSDFKVDTNIGTGSGTYPGQGGINHNYETKVTYENIYNATLQGQDSLAHNLQLDWTAAYSRGFSNTPDWGTLSTQSTAGSDPVYTYSGWGGKWWQNTDNDYSGYINLTYKTSLFGQDVKFKVGGMSRAKSRVDVYEDYSLNPTMAGQNTVYTPTNNSDTLWQIKGAEAQGSPYDANNYSVDEDITGIYGMVNFNVGRKIEVMGGLRGENTWLSFHDPLP